MSTFDEINSLVEASDIDAPIFTGFAPTGATAPYMVHRPLYVNPEAESIAGQAIDWDFQTSIYCCGESVEASFNLAMAVMGALSGAYVAGPKTTLKTSMGYSGAPVEGHYESQVTVQLNQGGI